MMNLTADNCRICVVLHFNARDAVRMNVAFFEVSHAILESEYSNIFSMMDVAPSKEWIRLILHPNTGQGIPSDLAILELSLCSISDINADILTVGYSAVPHLRIGCCPFDAHRRANRGRGVYMAAINHR